MPEFNYRISSRKCSSERLGPCEVCKKPVSDVHMQVESRNYVNAHGMPSYTYDGCKDLFGHKECLESKRR